MTLEEVIRIASMCAKGRGSECRNNECPLYSVDYCIRKLLGNAVTYLSMYQKGIPLGDSTRPEIHAPLNPSPDLIGGIMGRYKKPLVTISISEMEETE